MNFRWPVMLFAGLVMSPVVAAQGPQRAGDLSKGQQIATQICAACHAADGNSTQSANPVLAGQHAEYTLKQLQNFKPQGGKPAERPNPVMAGMVAPLSTDDMRNLAAYYESQKPKLRAARDPGRVKLGQAVYRGGVLAKNAAACTACHGPNGAGVPAQFPRLAGQFPEYVVAQLKAFRSGERTNDSNRTMRAVAEKLSDREIEAVSEYVAGLR